MSHSQVFRLVQPIVEPVVNALGLELVDVELNRENNKKILRLIIDKKGGVSLDDCTAVSEQSDPLLDESGVVKDYDYFEVSSPGVDRPLKTVSDCLRHQGEVVSVKLYRALDGQKTFTGELADCDEDNVSIVTANGETKTFDRSAVALLKRLVRF